MTKTTRRTLGALSLLILAACNETSFTDSQRTRSDIEIPQLDAGQEDANAFSPPETPPPAREVYEQSFPSSPIQEVEAELNLKAGYLDQDLVMTNLYSDQSLSFEQLDRPIQTKLFEQGLSPQPILEAFQQNNDRGILDLLIVIDNSGSMAEEQKNLATKLESLLTYIGDSNWQIGIVTTDAANPCLRALIRRGDANATEAFRQGISAGTQGSGNEEGIRTAVMGLSCTANPWIRPQSTLAILIVSDEDNCSNNGYECSGKAWNKPSYLTNYLRSNMQRELGTQARIYGLIWHPSMDSCTDAFNKATQYATAIAESSGTYGSICANDYSPTLRRISQDISSILKTQFTLKTMPNMSSVTLMINGVPSNGFVINGTTMTLNTPPPPGATIEARYLVGGSPIHKTFTLATAAEADTLSVMLNQQLISPSAYSLDPSGLELSFRDTPAEAAKIRVSYRTRMPLRSRFSIGPKAVASTINVWVNGKESLEQSYDSNKGEISFTSPPPDGAKILARFKQSEGKRLNYAFPVANGSPQELSASDKVTGAKVRVSWHESELKIEPEDFREGSTLVVSYRPQVASPVQFPLPPGLKAESLIISSADSTCTLGHGIVLESAGLEFSCALAAATDFSIRYLYTKPALLEFPLSISNPFRVARWQVWIDDKATDDFSIVDSQRLVLQSEPPAGSIVRVRLSDGALID